MRDPHGHPSAHPQQHGIVQNPASGIANEGVTQLAHPDTGYIARTQVLGKCENVGVLDLNLAPATDVPDGYVFHECPILGDGAR